MNEFSYSARILIYLDGALALSNHRRCQIECHTITKDETKYFVTWGFPRTVFSLAGSIYIKNTGSECPY